MKTNNTTAFSTHERWMRRALQLASNAGGHASPNPMVGAVVVHNGRIIGEGFHRRCGQPHAEVNALAAVNDRSLLPHSTIYVTLEPCAHYGKTPPCAQLLIDNRVGHVVVGMLDPFEKVSGRGVAMLREAGIDVTVGVLEEECRQLNRRFITAHTLHRPWILLKWAQTAGGFMATPERRLMISTPLTTRLMHAERAKVDAIAVGAATVLTDDPSLTIRYMTHIALDEQQPVRVVIADSRPLPQDCRLRNDGCRTLVVDATLPLEQWLTDLYQSGITSIMVEGGARTLNHFIESGLWDEARIELSPEVITQGTHAPRISGTVINDRIVDGNHIFRLQNDVKKV